MKYIRKLSGMVILCVLLSNQADTVCLFCKDVVEPTDCDTVTRCGSHEQCYMDAFVTVAGGVRYDLGCRDLAQCNGVSSFGRRRSTGTLICSECCSGNICNSAGCGYHGYSSTRGPLCYNCLQQHDPGDCSKITVCGQDEVCLLRKTINSASHKVRYQTRCESDRICRDELQKYQQLSSSLIGKRNPDIHGGSCSLQCCNTDMCNNNCNGSALVSSASSTASFPIPTTPDSSSVVTTTSFMTSSAAKTSTTPSSSAVTRTSSTTAPVVTLSTGLKFTTTSSKNMCQDQPGVDCHLLDISLGLCQDMNAASKYCTKYCGFC